MIAENLWHHLEQMGLSETDENHPVFGNTKQALEALIQQRFELVNRMDLSHMFYNAPCLYILIQASNFILNLLYCRYLQKNKASGPEGNTLYYELAERALDGQMSERIKEYISQIMIENGTKWQGFHI